MLKKLKRKFVEAADKYYRGNPGMPGYARRVKYGSIRELAKEHFENNSEPGHPCRDTLEMALNMLNGTPAVIVETGSSAWGANSSLLFDSYVNSFGGSFSTVDIRAEPMLHLKSKCTTNSRFFCDDSVSFLQKYVRNAPKCDLIYLDSWDVNWSDPLPSALHGFNEFMTILPVLLKGGLLLVDDTPIDIYALNMVQSSPNIREFNSFMEIYGVPPGKGSLIKNYLVNNNIGKEIAHGYQLLWSF